VGVNATAVDRGDPGSAFVLEQQNSRANAEPAGRKLDRGPDSKSKFAFSPPSQRTADVIDLCDSPPPKLAPSRTGFAMSAMPPQTNEVVDLCASPPSKRSRRESSIKGDQKALRRLVLKEARERSSMFCGFIEKPLLDEESLLSFLRAAVVWAKAQKGVPTGQQSAAAGDTGANMAAWVSSPRRARPIVNVSIY